MVEQPRSISRGILEVSILVSIYDADIPENITGVLETYRVRPEGMSLEEWYMSQGPITPPPSEIPSGPPSSWGAEARPVAVEEPSGQYYEVAKPVFEEISTVEDIMVSKGFQKGEYGGYYKPETQAERPKDVTLGDPFAGRDRLAEFESIMGDGTVEQQGAENGSLTTTGGDIAPVLLLLGIALTMG
jgi:hypothetical protein